VSRPRTRRTARGLAALALFAALVAGTASAQSPGPTILFRWLDGEGKVHYTDNFNAIPDRFRASAVQGVFVEGTASPVPVGGAASSPAAKAGSGKLDLIEVNHVTAGDTLRVEGRVRNGFSRVLDTVRVKVSFFDRADAFLFAESTVVDPTALPPGAEGTFRLVVRAAPEIASYKTEMSWK
jgi:hypothetical protein